MLPKEERALGIKDKKTKDKYVNKIWLQNEWRLEETSLMQKKKFVLFFLMQLPYFQCIKIIFEKRDRAYLLSSKF